MSHKTPQQRRYDKELTLHHRKPRSQGGKNDYPNLSWVPRLQHQSYHNCFGVQSPQQICKLLNDLYIDPAYMFICVRKE